MSNAERDILRRMKELGRAELSPEEIQQVIYGVRATLANQVPTDASLVPDQPSIRPVPEASYGSAEGAQRRALHGPIRWRIGRFIMNRPGRAVAASIVILVGVVAMWVVLGRGASMAFADVLQQIREIHTVKYKQTITSSMTGDALSTSTSEVLVADRYRSRSTLSNGDVIMITDSTPGNDRLLMLNAQKRTALLVRRTGREESEKPNLLDRVLKLDEKRAKAIGQKEIDGHLADGFRVDTDDQNNTFWIDPQTRLPVRVEIASIPGWTPSRHIVMTDFQWNVPVDASLVSTTPPPGYEQNDLGMDLSAPAEKDLVAGLKSFAELNQDRFPDDFGMKAYMKLMTALDAKRNTTRQAEVVKIGQKLMPVARAIGFAGNPTMGQDWHYAGKGVPLGQSGTPVLWYKPKDSPTYRVIYADLAVADVQPGDVPTVASVTIQPLPTPPPATQSQSTATHQR